jgi:hypothetical protein
MSFIIFLNYFFHYIFHIFLLLHYFYEHFYIFSIFYFFTHQYSCYCTVANLTLST